VTRLEALLASGELVALAKTVATRPALAAAVGMSDGAYSGHVRRIRAAGRPFPGFEELRRIALGFVESDAVIRKSDNRIGPSIPSEGTGVPILGTAEESAGKWPSVAAFDAGQDEPPLPSIPQGHAVRGVSSLVDADGQIKAQWIKTSAQDADDRRALLDAVAHLCSEATKIESVAPRSVDHDDDLLCVYPMGDPHFGASITGDDAGDLAAIERNLYSAVDHLVSLAPPAKYAWLASVGDTLHHNGQKLTANGTRVGGAGTGAMFGSTLRTIRRLALRCSEKHQHTRISIAEGNHDSDMAAAASAALVLLLEGNERITVDLTLDAFHWYRFGQNLLGLTHGHRGKAVDLMGVMAVDRAKDWGETVHRKIYSGHVHHDVVKEAPGVTVEHLRTLAPLDDWHRREGYRAGRDMRVDVIHRRHGHINRHIVGIQQLVARTA
jgi:hypothetical protein